MESLSTNVTCTDMISKRVCCIRLEMKSFCFVSALNESMLAHIPSGLNIHKASPTIPGCDAEIDYAREESLYWYNIWIQCDRPESCITYDIMKKWRSAYHYYYMLRSLKKERKNNIKVTISKDSMNSNQGTY